MTTQKLVSTSEHVYTPKADCLETKQGLTFEIELPGVSREGITVDVKGRDLRIRGVTPSQADDTVGQGHEGDALATLSLPKPWQGLVFERRFTMPEGFDAERLTASFAHGLLRVDLPREPVREPRRITVTAA